MKRKYVITLLTCALVIGLVYSSRFIFNYNDNANVLKIGFIFVGDDSTPYTHNYILAANAIKETYEDKVDCIELYNVPEGSEELALKRLVEEGCQMIIGGSYGYKDKFKEYAMFYPNIEFVAATGDNSSDDVSNYHTFMGEIYEGRYVSGVVAGLKLQQLIDRGIIQPADAWIGYVAAYPYAEVISGYTAFFLGVRSILPTAKMRVSYANSWSDYTVEKNIASRLIDEGCVIISQHSDTLGPAVACEKTDVSKHVYNVSYNQSMIDVAPTTSLVGCRINWNVYLLQAVDALLKGRDIEQNMDANIHGNDAGAGFAKGWVEMLELNKTIAAPNTQKIMDDTIKDLIHGRIQVFKGDYVGVDPFDPNDIYYLNMGFDENANSSAPSFHYILEDVIIIEE